MDPTHIGFKNKHYRDPCKAETCSKYKASPKEGKSISWQVVKAGISMRLLAVWLLNPYGTLFYGEHTFSRFAPVQNNLLPDSLKQSPTLTAFKLGLKTHLFQSAYY